MAGTQAPSTPPRRWTVKRLALAAVAGAALIFAGYLLVLDVQVLHTLRGKQWDLPTRIYARPLELYRGRSLSVDHLVAELQAAGYQAVRRADRPGTFERNRNRFLIYKRPFNFGEGEEPAAPVWVEIGSGKIATLADGDRKDLDLVRLDPALIGSIYPDSNEDREVVPYAEFPPLLIDTLIAVEDKRFREHFGIDIRGVARALRANLQAGEITQGGSTLSQQLAENLFFDERPGLVGKVREALMAVLLELHTDKDKIIEIYLNEVFMAQQGNRAIHGFGLASQHFFGRPLDQLEPQHIATLVGMLKGPSLYHPRRKPDNALKRRAVVLDLMAEAELIAPEQAESLKQTPLGVTKSAPRISTRFTDYVQLVRRQLRESYDEEALGEDGLMVLTGMSPVAQLAAERALEESLATELQGAVVVVEPHTGEITALVGGRGSATGFNRALEARRQVGSVFKPMVYLAALQGNEHTLASLVDDSRFSMRSGGEQWTPANFDGQYHGKVMLIDALARSLNAATARLGQEVGIEQVFRLVRDLGVEISADPLPSAALGAVELTPLEVAQLYQGLASGGYPIKLSAIREVLDSEHRPLQRFGVELTQVQRPETTYLITWAMMEVTRSGTARGLARFLGRGFDVAGKTGTTNDGRDAWFAGFTDDTLAVVWVGRDDAKPANLSGAGNAMPVFGKLVGEISKHELDMPRPPEIVSLAVDRATGMRPGEWCDDVVQVPFIQGSEPREYIACDRPDSFWERWEMERQEREDRRRRERRAKEPWWKRIF